MAKTPRLRAPKFRRREAKHLVDTLSVDLFGGPLHGQVLKVGVYADASGRFVQRNLDVEINGGRDVRYTQGEVGAAYYAGTIDLFGKFVEPPIKADG